MAAFGETEVREYWEKFSNPVDFEETEDGFSENLASDVLKYYNIETHTTAGGKLANLDIKQMDAITVIKLSLVDDAVKNGKLLEVFLNNEGAVEFKEAGEFSANVTDIYHTIQTMNYKEECTGVMVTGGKPLSYRKELEWVNLWGETKDKDIYDTDQMNNSACVSDVFNQYSSIIFPDPHLDSSYKDGIDNLYEINESNPYDNIIGYAYYHKVDPSYFGVDTTVNLV
nr:hypothetical protein [Sulfurovaceae bacterium]